MWNYPKEYDVIVVGAGHAGCEAAHAAASMGMSTLLLSQNLDTIAKMSCNPSIGGTAKGHLVREIDALGGIMGKIADETAIHVRLLNRSKGTAVQSPRAQADKALYSRMMKAHLESLEYLDLKQADVIGLIVEEKIKGVETKEGVAFLGKTVILTTGTFLQGKLFIGKRTFPGGRLGDAPSTLDLRAYGLNIGKLKTGTPPRVHKRSIDFSKTEIQPSEEGVFFSFDKKIERKKGPCHITYTTQRTKEIILRDINESARFSGMIEGVGPRYCPSIEDKFVRFERERHQVFLEPEGDTEEIYLGGVSTSLPYSSQVEYVRSIIGLERAEIMRPAYAIEYDYALSSQLYFSLETKKIEGLFLAGQINGTTGYEEAGSQGLIAGINAAKKARGEEPFVLKRSESYIGVMIDDLITKTLDEPYRMFTSRAEYRLLLRQDNADLRLRAYGYQLGLITKEQFTRVEEKRRAILEEKKRLGHVVVKGVSLLKLLLRPENSYAGLLKDYPEMRDLGEANEQIEVECKYAGYIARQQKEIEKLSDLESIVLPKDFFFEKLSLSKETKEKLKRYLPPTLGAASRIAGISSADIAILATVFR